MKKHFISDLKSGETYTSDFAILKKQTRTTKNNRPYLILELADKTGTIAGRMWEEIENEQKWIDIKVGNIYEIEGKVEEYQGNIQFIISHIKEVSDYDKSDFLATIEEDVEELWNELRSIHKDITNKWLTKILDAFFEDKDFSTKFKEAPAAKVIHDSALGGLLRHTLRMTKLALKVIDFYPEMSIDKDIVVVGIAFHDMEKINEYCFDGPIVDYTDRGHFVGHTVMACNSIYSKIKEIKDFPKEIENHLIHIIASHAGEYDPIRLPSTPEAMIVHLVDTIDSRLVHFQQEKIQSDNQVWKKDFYTNSWMFFGGNKDNSSEETLF